MDSLFFFGCNAYNDAIDEEVVNSDCFLLINCAVMPVMLSSHVTPALKQEDWGDPVLGCSCSGSHRSGVEGGGGQAAGLALRPPPLFWHEKSTGSSIYLFLYRNAHVVQIYSSDSMDL